MTSRLKKPTQFIPATRRSAVMALSKAALADIAWNLAGRSADSAEDEDEVFKILAEEVRITVGEYRKDTVPEEFRVPDGS